MLYNQAWEEMKDYIKHRLRLLIGQEVIRQRLLEEMKQLEERWKIIPAEDCPICHGEGVVMDSNAPCTECDGSGKVGGEG